MFAKRLPEEAHALLAALADYDRVTQTEIVERALIAYAFPRSGEDGSDVAVALERYADVRPRQYEWDVYTEGETP
jgi:hypothetical protein